MALEIIRVKHLSKSYLQYSLKLQCYNFSILCTTIGWLLCVEIYRDWASRNRAVVKNCLLCPSKLRNSLMHWFIVDLPQSANLSFLLPKPRPFLSAPLQSSRQRQSCTDRWKEGGWPLGKMIYEQGERGKSLGYRGRIEDKGKAGQCRTKIAKQNVQGQKKEKYDCKIFFGKVH